MPAVHTVFAQGTAGKRCRGWAVRRKHPPDSEPRPSTSMTTKRDLADDAEMEPTTGVEPVTC